MADLSVSVEDGRLAAVRVGGFDTLPASARQAVADAVAAGLAGAPADLPAAALAARVRAAVPVGVELVGTSPVAMAAAVRRVVGVAENPDRVGAYTVADVARLTGGWADFGWRLIPERPLPAALNVALDEVLIDRVARGVRPPTLRFWGWAEPAVVIGRSQAVANELQPDAGVTVVRRITGGGAMVVQPGQTITYSLVLPAAAVAGLSIRQSYEVCDAWAVLALRAAGLDAHSIPVNDIGWADGKIAGAAQARRSGVVLHHTTMAYALDAADMRRLLRVGLEKRTDRAVSSAAKAVSPLTRQTALGRDEMVTRLADGFLKQYGGDADDLTADELAAAERLVADKYATEAWTREFG